MHLLKKSELHIGFVPLVDAGPIIIALEKGFFDRRGLKVTLSREVSWANIRDKLSVGLLDAAHLLAPMACASAFDSTGTPLVTGLSLGLNGNSICISRRLQLEMEDACDETGEPFHTTEAQLVETVRARKRRGKPLRFGIVYNDSMHNYLLRFWLASLGIDPDEDVELEVIPPPYMAGQLWIGQIDGFSVGEPWANQAIAEGKGVRLMADHAIWNCHPEKVLAVTEDWHDANPETHLAMIAALIEALQWMEDPYHQDELIEILAGEKYINVDAELIAPGVKGQIPLRGQTDIGFPDFNLFMRHQAAFPWRSHALWILTQMARWGRIDMGQDLERIASRVYRPDLYRAAAKLLNIVVPLQDSKVEGLGAFEASTASSVDGLGLGSSLFCDGSQFDPADPSGYVEGFEIHHRRSTRKRLEVLS